MAAREEQETSITQNRLDDYVEIWTNNVVDVRTLEKEPRAKRQTLRGINREPLSEDNIPEYLEAGFGITYRISTDDFHPLKGFRRKRKPLTDEERAALGERLRGGKS